MAQSVLKAFGDGEGYRLHRPRLGVFLAFAGVVLIISLFFVWSRIQVIQLKYEISTLETTLRNGEQERRQLRLEVASLRNPSRIENIARTRLGLRLPTPDQIITVR